MFAVSHADEPDPAQVAQDAVIIETILRLESFDLEKSAKAKAAVLRKLAREPGSETYFKLIERFKVPEAKESLAKLALTKSTEDAGAQAARLLISLGGGDLLRQTALGKDPQTAANAVLVLGLAGGKEAHDILTPLVIAAERSPQERNAAVAALAKDTLGQKRLLELAQAGKLAADVQFTAANALHGSPDPAIRAAAAKHLALPSTAGDKPLPPIAELLKIKGDADRGRAVFTTVGTCNKCHIVKNEGKEVGPNLTEIGSKLSKEAIFASILDPSAAISHNYETYVATLHDGLVVSGLLVSQTERDVTLKNQEGVTRTIARDQIEELTKQPISLMPANLQKLLTVEQLVDVAEYLMTLKK